MCPLEYQADRFERPQIKVNEGVHHGDNLSGWLRYAQPGRTSASSEKSYRTDQSNNPIEAEHYRSDETRRFIASGDYIHTRSETSSSKTLPTLDSQEHMCYRPINRTYETESDNNIQQYAFPQDRVTATILYDAQPTAALNIVSEYEHPHIHVEASWGEGQGKLWIYEGVATFSGVDSAFIYRTLLSITDQTLRLPLKSVAVFASRSTITYWSRNTHYQTTSGVYAHRLDAPSLSDSTFSPRVFLVSALNADNKLVSTVQRMMPMMVQYLSDLADNRSKIKPPTALSGLTPTPFDYG